jgi:hypothetical protein
MATEVCVCGTTPLIGLDPTQHVVINVSGQVTVLSRKAVQKQPHTLWGRDLERALERKHEAAQAPPVVPATDNLHDLLQSLGNSTVAPGEIKRKTLNVYNRSCAKCVCLAYADRDTSVFHYVVEAFLHGSIAGWHKLDQVTRYRLDHELRFFDLALYGSYRLLTSLRNQPNRAEKKLARNFVKLFAMNRELLDTLNDPLLFRFFFNQAIEDYDLKGERSRNRGDKTTPVLKCILFEPVEEESRNMRDQGQSGWMQLAYRRPGAVVAEIQESMKPLIPEAHRDRLLNDALDDGDIRLDLRQHDEELKESKVEPKVPFQNGQRLLDQLRKLTPFASKSDRGHESTELVSSRPHRYASVHLDQFQEEDTETTGASDAHESGWVGRKARLTDAYWEQLDWKVLKTRIATLLAARQELVMNWSTTMGEYFIAFQSPILREYTERIFAERTGLVGTFSSAEPHLCHLPPSLANPLVSNYPYPMEWCRCKSRECKHVTTVDTMFFKAPLLQS